MARTYKDRPFKTRNRDFFPFGWSTRWNDCNTHGKLCSHGKKYNKDRCLKRRAFLNGEINAEEL